MKGEKLLIDRPFRYGGIFHNYDLDWVEWIDYMRGRSSSMRKCFCCGAPGDNLYDSTGHLVAHRYPYAAFFLYNRGSFKGKGYSTIRIICRACAYKYGKGVVEVDGNTYYNYDEFHEYLYEDSNERN